MSASASASASHPRPFAWAERTSPSDHPPTAPRVTFSWCLGKYRVTGYLVALTSPGYCRVDVDGIGYHPRLDWLRPAGDIPIGVQPL